MMAAPVISYGSSKPRYGYRTAQSATGCGSMVCLWPSGRQAGAITSGMSERPISSPGAMVKSRNA